MNFARRVADRVIFMADGQIVETGTPDEFFDHPKTQRARDFLNSIKGHSGPLVPGAPVFNS